VSSSARIPPQWVDKFEIMRLKPGLAADPEFFENYLARLDSREHSDPLLRDMNQKEYYWSTNMARQVEDSEGTVKTLSATSYGLKNALVNQLADPDGVETSKDKKVNILACAEWTQLQAVAKTVVTEGGRLQKELQSCALLLAQLKNRKEPACQQLAGKCQPNYEAGQKLVQALLDKAGCAKAVEPQDKDQSVCLLPDMKQMRNDILIMIQGIRDAKVEVNSTLKTAQKALADAAQARAASCLVSLLDCCSRFKHATSVPHSVCL
jgi:hypothetical protein